jgi:hypothetical protein
MFVVFVPENGSTNSLDPGGPGGPWLPEMAKTRRDFQSGLSTATRTRKKAGSTDDQEGEAGGLGNRGGVDKHPS